MDNPFKKRRTEFIADRRSFLSLVSPTPIDDFFDGEESQLIDKLVLVVGTPGCGKTTLAQILEFESLTTLCLPDGGVNNKALVSVLEDRRLTVDGLPRVVAYRLSMSTIFRGIWELPYPESIRTTLLRAYVQAKAVLGWYRQLESLSIPDEQIEIVLDGSADSLRSITRADNSAAFRGYAKEIELGIFKLATALVPPPEAQMAGDFINTSYDVFEGLKAIRIVDSPLRPGETISLRPMIIIDDAHELHPTQFIQLRDWLKSKAMGVSRWIMSRADIVAPEDYRAALEDDTASSTTAVPGSTVGRDYVIRLLQFRKKEKFKPTAVDIAKRYIDSIPEFSRRSIKDLSHGIDGKSASLPAGELKDLKESVKKLGTAVRFSDRLVEKLRARVPGSAREDEGLAALRILMHRESRKQPQMGLLEDEQRDIAVSDDRQAAASLVDGARIQLMHEYERPFYYGMDKLIAASNYNIEQFIRLADVLVDQLLARTIRNRTFELDARSQHAALVGASKSIIREWDFPFHSAVQTLVERIGRRCVEKTLQPNAPLDDGANAYAVLQDEMDRVLQRSERLTRVLHFACAYQALIMVPQYRCKGKVWCVLELGAIPCMAYGLTLNRGGFLEGTLSELDSLVDGSEQA
jgi:hypothetical protein